MTLKEVKPGATVKVLKISGEGAVKRRIMEMGLTKGISGLMVPRLKGAVFYLRIIYVLLSAVLGLYGYILGVTLTVVHILDLSSFGTSSTVSLDRTSFQSLKDSIWRAPREKMRTRPFFNRNIVRSRVKKTK